jgi:hypothetical protein
MTQPIVNPSRQEFRGRSLAYIRTLLHKKPRAASCFGMAQRFKNHLVQEPQIGMVCFFGDREPGDCGLLVEDQRVLMLDQQGRPLIMPFNKVPMPFLGAMYWPEDKR